MTDNLDGVPLAKDLLKATQELEVLLEMVRKALGDEVDSEDLQKKKQNPSSQ